MGREGRTRMLGTQERHVVEYIQSHPGALQQELAAHFGVSERSIRSYISHANEGIEPAAHLTKKRGGGYYLIVDDEERFQEVTKGKEGLIAASVPTTPEERVVYLLNDLLARTDWITIDDLSSILFVSRNAITSDLRRVEEELNRFNLTLERRPHYGIRVKGPEMSRRLCLANVVLNSLIENNGDENRASLDVISQCVVAVLNEEAFQVNSASYQNLIVHIAVAASRIRKNCFVPMEAGQLDLMRGGREFSVAEKIAAAIGDALGIEFPEEEVGYIAIHLAGKHSIYANAGGSEGLTISDEVWGVVSEMLDVVWETYHFDFRDDLELRMNLARHIVPLSVRLRYNMRLDNPLLPDIKKRYALAFSMALDASSVLAEHYESELSEDELGYIALAFALAIERKKSELPKKNILVVCASGQGSARLLEWRYRKEFGQWIDKIELCDVSHIDNVDFSGIDYVFTTVPIHRQLPVPVREVEFFLDDEGARAVRNTLTESLTTNDLACYFDPDLFIVHMQAKDKGEVIDELCEHIARVRRVPENFRALVEKRERAAQTSFGNQVAMPHPYKAVTDETFVCVGLLDAPVLWNDRDVRAVFLVSISKRRDRHLDRFYRSMAGLLTSAEAIQNLIDNQDWATFLELLDRYGKPSEKE